MEVDVLLGPVANLGASKTSIFGSWMRNDVTIYIWNNDILMEKLMDYTLMSKELREYLVVYRVAISSYV
jgi:hypothetical protein